MAVKKGDTVFIGKAGGICGYMSHGINIIRKSSSLTGKRVGRDPAFQGFRASGNRMKQASPIASSLYKLIPEEQKVYSLYRTLTGAALKMIKEGLDKEIIVARLREQYIDPLIEQPEPVKQAQVVRRIADWSDKVGNYIISGLPVLKAGVRSQGKAIRSLPVIRKHRTIPYISERRQLLLSQSYQNREEDLVQLLPLQTKRTQYQALNLHE